MHTTSPGSRALRAAGSAVKPAMRSALWLLSVMVPVSFAVAILRWSGVLTTVAGWLAPAFEIVGLPGEAALAFLSAVFLNIYSALGVMSSITLEHREVTILALMCLFTHNLPVETAVQKRTGSSAWAIVLLRLSGTVLGALLLNLLLPGPAASGGGGTAGTIQTRTGLMSALAEWGQSAGVMIATVIAIITALMILQRLLREFGVLEWLSRVLRPPLRAMGLPEETAFLWVVSNTLGLAYGSAVLIEEVEQERLSLRSSDLLNHHIAVSHSLLEDTLLFVAVGAYLGWIVIPRLLFATAVVWAKRAFGS